MAIPPYAELHCHSNFSFLDGASAPDELVERAVELGLSGLAVTDHGGLYGVVRFVTAAEEAGLHPVIGVELELVDAAAPDPASVVVPARRPVRRGPKGDWGVGSGVESMRLGSVDSTPLVPVAWEGRPARLRPARARLPGHRGTVKEDLRGVGERQRGPHLTLLARDSTGYRSLCRLISRANLAGTKRVPRVTQALLADNVEGLVALSGCRESEIVRRLRIGDRAGARAVAERYAGLFGRGVGRDGGDGRAAGGREGPCGRGAGNRGRGGANRRGGDGPATSGFFLELSHHLLPDDDWLVAETAALAEELGLPCVVTNDVHYARSEDRELHDVVTAIFHGRTLDTLADLRRPDGESYLKSAADMAALPPGDPAFARSEPRAARAWTEGLAVAGELAASCSVDLGFERYRFPGFDVPKGETAFSYLVELCQSGARRRYHPLTPSVVRQLAHELDVIERTGLAEFFLICWDLMRFARDRGIPAQGRGSAADSIVAYVLGITRVDPIRHNLLFERFINEGRTTYPDVDIDFSSERREEVIQYVYERYGPEHTGMVCNLVTYRARSAVREVGYALGFPRPLVDRVAKALETYDSVMVRRDLEADGGFAEFFRRPGGDRLSGEDEAPEARAAVMAGQRGLTDRMGQLAHTRGGRFAASGAGAAGRDTGADAPAGASGPDFRQISPPVVLSDETKPAATSSGEDRARPIADEPHLDPFSGPAGACASHTTTPSAKWQQPEAAGVVTGPDLRAAARPEPPATAASPEPPATAASPKLGQILTTRTLGEINRASAPSSAGDQVEFIPTQAWAGMDSVEDEAGDASSGVASAPNGHLVGIWQGSGGETTAKPGTTMGPGPGNALGPGPGNGIWAAPTGPGPGHAIGPGPGNGTWAASAGSAPSIRAGGRGDDEGGPGDTPASVAWLRAGRGTGYTEQREGGRGTGYTEERERMLPPGLVAGRAIDPESGMPEPPARQTDRLGRPNRWDPPAPPAQSMGRGGRGASSSHSSVARVEPEPPPQPRGGSTVGMSDWERWLEFCARIDGFPRHLSIHSGGMLVTAAPLIDIAPLERATMPDRVVVQYDKRDVETLKLIKLDLLGLGMLAAMDEAMQLIESDCAVCLDFDRLPEEIPEVFRMLQAADTVGVFQVESRAQMQTLPKSRPESLDDLVVEVAIIRPGPIQGNAVHPYLRRKQGLEPVAYLHPSLEPILRDTLGVILYQEQVMRIAIEVAGFTPAGSDGFRRAMGTWRSNREMEKLHRQFVGGCLEQPGMDDAMAEELFRQVSAFASFGFAKSHAAAFARTAYESAFLKLFYPAQFLVGLINAQPMGFYPVEVLVNDSKRHGVAVLPVDINASVYKTTTEWVGRPGWALAGEAGDEGAFDGDPGEPLLAGTGIDTRPKPVRSTSCVIPSAAARQRWAADSAVGWGVRLGLHLVKGIGDQHEERLDAELARGPYRSLEDVVDRTGLPEEVIERLIRAGALDSLGRPRRELLWQLREVAGATRGRIDGREIRSGPSRPAGTPSKSAPGRRSASLRLPATEAPELPPITETERLGDAYGVIGLDARRQVVALFRPALDRLGAVSNAALADRKPGKIRIGGLVVTRQHPMTARGTVFLALEDETGMVNVTLWPDTWARLRGIVRRHALLLVDGDLQRESEVVNVIAFDVRSLTEAAATVGGPDQPTGVRQLGHAGMRRLG